MASVGVRVRGKGAVGGLVVTHAVLIVAGAIMFAPYVLQILTSLKTYEETLLIPPTLFPAVPHWGNYFSVSYKDFPILTELFNSVVVSLARVAGQLLFASMAAYAFARLRFPFKRALFALFISVLMVPSQLFLIPQYQVMQKLNLLDTLPALFLPGMFSAFGVFLLRQFFMSLPKELDEAAPPRRRQYLADLLLHPAAAAQARVDRAGALDPGVQLERPAVAAGGQLDPGAIARVGGAGEPSGAVCHAIRIDHGRRGDRVRADRRSLPALAEAIHSRLRDKRSEVDRMRRRAGNKKPVQICDLNGLKFGLRGHAASVVFPR